MSLKWTELAATDLDLIENHIATQNSSNVAIDAVLRVIDTTELVLSDHPRACCVGRVSGTRELLIDGLPFTAIYRQNEVDQIQVLRILYDAKRWPSTQNHTIHISTG